MDITSFSQVIKTAIAMLMSIVSLFISWGGLPVKPADKTLDMSKFELAWADEFDGSELDSSKWEMLHYSGNATAMRRGGYWNKSLTSVSDGCLRIATEYMPDGIDGNGLPGWYTCGISTEGRYDQAFGYFEVRCILPKGVGQWAAFWMLCGGMGNIENGGTDGAEIDVFESCFYEERGRAQNAVSTNIHINGYGEAHEMENVCEPRITENNPYEEFNTYGLEWNEDEYIFYINGEETGRSSFGGTSRVNEYLILSVEVGGENGVTGESWVGSSIESNTEPLSDFVIDYVRTYQYK